MHATVRRHQQVVEAGVDPRLVVFPAPVGVLVRRPCAGKRVHAVLVLQHVRRVEAVFATGTRYQAVVVAIIAPVLVAQCIQLALALVPVNSDLLLRRRLAGIADRFVVEFDGSLGAGLGVLVLHRGDRNLIGDHATGAELHLARQTVLHF